MPLTAVSQGTQFANAYPFVAPSADVRGLLSDFYLSYEDATKHFVLPFQVFWLYGFGTNPSAPTPGAPTPTHAYDVVILDANGVVVFDSTTGTMGSTTWNTRTIVEWLTESACCRVVINSEASNWPTNISPLDGVLDARTYRAQPPRVTALRYADTLYIGGVDLANGYNTTFAATPDTDSDGGPLSFNVTMAAVPGSGLGVQPGCNPVEILVRTINGQQPSAAGKFNVDAQDCYKVQVPVTIGEEAGQRVAYAGEESLDPSLWGHAMSLSSRCGPCCACQDYVNTYLGLKSVWNLWLAAAGQLESIRNTYAANRARWLAEYDCRTNNTGRLVAIPEPGCSIQFTGSYCNASKCCITPVEFRFTHQLYVGGVYTASVTATATDALMSAPGTDGPQPIVMAGHYPLFKTTVNYADPQTLSVVQYRLYVSPCAADVSVITTLTVHVPDPAPAAGTGETCDLPVVTVPADIVAIWTGLGDLPIWPARFLTSKAVPTNSAPRTYNCG